MEDTEKCQYIYYYTRLAMYYYMYNNNVSSYVHRLSQYPTI